MMKMVLMLLFINFMLFKNKMMMFYYNLCFLMSGGMLFMYSFKDFVWSSVSLGMGVEYYSIWLIILSFWIISLMLMCLGSSGIMQVVMFLSLMLVMVLFFMSMDLFMFYLMFEISLIPTFFLIIYWGSNPERLSASYYLVLYLLLVSFPLLIFIFNMYMYSLTFKMSLMMMVMGLYELSFWSYLMIYLAFFIKMPMYILHVWLPKAHVEAPVYGSMILAGVLLKMGSYGLIRLFEILVMSVKYNYLILSISIVGSALVGMVCLLQIDMKSLVAYSSVVHMNLMLCSLMTLFKLGMLSSYIMMISHGLCSSGLFYMVNLYYSRTSSRLLVLNKGMMAQMPSMSLWWFLLCVSNFSFPFSLNFISEVIILSVVLNWEFMLMGYLMLICFFSSAYSLYLFSYVQQGKKPGTEFSSGGLVIEFLVLIMHYYPLVLLLLNLLMFM